MPTTHLRAVSRLRMSETTLPLPDVLSQCVQRQFYLDLYLCFALLLHSFTDACFSLVFQVSKNRTFLFTVFETLMVFLVSADKW
jgi:hypothetical protein